MPWEGGYGTQREGKRFDSRSGKCWKKGITDSYDSQSFVGEDGVGGHDAS